MPAQHANPGEIIDVGPLGPRLSETNTEAFLKEEGLEVIRLILPQGKNIPTHHAPGPITVHCLEGRIEFTARGETRELKAGQMLYLLGKEPHSLHALEASSVLVTLRLPTDANA
jgi:quercetin dioxygenase-like cupin family protein